MSSADPGSEVPAGSDASTDPIANDKAGDPGINLGLAVGIPVAVVAGLLLILLVVLLVWKWKYKRKYSMNKSLTPTKTLTHNEEQLSNATPPGYPGTKNGNAMSRPEILLRTPSREAELCVVRHYYEAQETEQLTLQTGRIVEVIEKNPNGWWRGMIEDSVGWFPAAYVRKIEASEKVKYKQQSNQNTPEKKSASPKRLVKKNHSEAQNKKRAPTIPNGTQPVGQQSEIRATLETSVRSDTHQLISSGEESTLDSTTQGDVKDNGIVQPVIDIETVDNEEKLEGFINDIFTVEDELTPRSSIVEPESRLTSRQSAQSLGHVEQVELQTQRSHQVSAESFSNAEVCSQSENSLQDKNAPKSKPTPAKTKPTPTTREPTPAKSKPTPAQREQLGVGVGRTTSSEGQEEIGMAGSDRQPATEGPTSPVVLHSTPKRKSVSDKKLQTYVAMYPFTAVHREQLSLSPNDVILSHGHVVNGWIKGSKRGETQEGWFPDSYVREAHDNGTLSVSKSSVAVVDKSLSESEFSDADQSFEDELTGMAYRVIHPYTAKQEGDLELKEGDLVVVLESLENGWWRGVLAGKEGWFPGSYVQVIPQTPMVSKDAQNPFCTLPRNFKQGDFDEEVFNTEVDSGKRSTLPPGLSAALLLDEDHVTMQEEKEEENSLRHKPSVPKRFVIPKLVKAHKNKSQKKRPVKAPPPAPPPALPGVNEPIAPPRRSKRVSVSRPTVPPPRPPSELDSSAGSGEFGEACYSTVDFNQTPRSTREKAELVDGTSSAKPYHSNIGNASELRGIRSGNLEKSLSPSMYGHNGSQMSNSSSMYDDVEYKTPDVSMEGPLEDTEVFENMVTLSPIFHNNTERIHRSSRDSHVDMGEKGVDISLDIDRSRIAGVTNISGVSKNREENPTGFSSFKQERDTTVVESVEPVYAVVQKKQQKTKVEHSHLEQDNNGQSAASPVVSKPSEVPLEHGVQTGRSPKTGPLQVSQGKVKPAIGPKPPTPLARQLFEGCDLGEHASREHRLQKGNNKRSEHQSPSEQGNDTVLKEGKHRDGSLLEQSGKVDKKELDIKQDTTDMQLSNENKARFDLTLDSEEKDQGLLAEIMNSFEDLKTSIDSPSSSLSVSETANTVSGHNDLSCPLDAREPVQGHYESSISSGGKRTLPGIGSHKTHQEGRKSDLLPATYAQDPMEMGSKQQSVVYDSNQEVGSPPSKAVTQAKPPLPAKPSLSPKFISGNSDMSTKSESSFERSNVTSDSSHSSDQLNNSLSVYGLHPNYTSYSDLPDDVADSDSTANYMVGNTSDVPPPLPEGPPPESPLIETRLPKPERTVLSRALNTAHHSDLVMTSPYVVIKTPNANSPELLDMDTEEVCVLTRSTEEETLEPQEDGGKRKTGSEGSEQGGLRQQISGLLDRILPDMFNPNTRDSDSDQDTTGHPVSQIEFLDSFNFKRHYHGMDEDQVQNNGQVDREEQSSDVSFMDDVSEVSSSSTSPGTKPKSKRPAKPPRKSKSISSDEERSFMKQREDEAKQFGSKSKKEKDIGLTKYQLPILRPPPVSDLTERYRKTSAGSVPSLGSTPPTSPDSASPVKLDSPRNYGLSLTAKSYSQEVEQVDHNKDVKTFDKGIKHTHSQDEGSHVITAADHDVKEKSKPDSPLRFFTPSKFVAKPYTPSPQIIQRDISLSDSVLSETDPTSNEVHFQVDQSQDKYSVRVLNSLNRQPSDDYKITGEGRQQGHESRIIEFDTPKPFHKPGELKKVTAPQSQPPQLIQYVEDDGRVYI